jgi:hypothetical protein
LEDGAVYGLGRLGGPAMDEGEDEMSKYSTDELCGILQYWKNRLRTHDEWDESLSLSDDKIMAEIKRRLRAADALLIAAKKVHVAVQVYADPNDYAEFKKAISAYEEKDENKA